MSQVEGHRSQRGVVRKGGEVLQGAGGQNQSLLEEDHLRSRKRL